MNLHELFSFLEKIGRQPQKGLSQNFLIEQNIVKKIVRTADVRPGDRVLEIGPGPGALTACLLDAGAEVLAIEKDRILSHALERLQTKDLRLSSLTADFLDFDLKALQPGWKVVANLPYSITTPILEKLFSYHDRFSSITIMVQKELAQRMIAPSGSKTFSSLSIFLAFYTTYNDSFPVSSSCFYPRPKVDSTVLRFDVKSQLPLEDPQPFFKLVRRAFQQRRKMLTSSLKEFYPSAKIQQALTLIGSRIDARPESLSLEQWIKFYSEITSLTKRETSL
jgi:16S rRNA (adenine1518-N6/adenine1519-N6)-dimethyltransferase